MNEPLIIDKFVESFERMNAAILEPYLDENALFNGMGKYSFLSHLHELFIKAKNDEVIQMVTVTKYCSECHPNKKVLEFYSKENKVEYYRYSASRRKLRPVFAFAILNDSNGKFDIELCINSWGYSKSRRYIDKESLSEIICSC
jgi:hypothetical protein